MEEIQRVLKRCKDSKKDYYVCIYSDGETIRLGFYDAETRIKDENLSVAFMKGKTFINSLPLFYSIPFKATILNITPFKNHGFPNSWQFAKAVQEKLNRLNVRHFFTSEYLWIISSVFTDALIVPKIGDTFFVIIIDPNYICKFLEFEFTENGYVKHGKDRIMKFCAASTTRDEILQGKIYTTIIVDNVYSISVTALTNLFKTDNITVVDTKNSKGFGSNFFCNMGKWLNDRSFNAFYVCPWSANDYYIIGKVGDVEGEIIHIETDEQLPLKKTIVIPKTFQSCIVESIGEAGDTDILENKIFDKECHKTEITFKIDEEHFYSFLIKNIILPKIQNLSKTLDQNQKSKIPVIGFWDNSSIICASKNGGKYKFLQSWNGMKFMLISPLRKFILGMYGKELFITFNKKRPTFFDTKSMGSDETKMNFVVYDILKIMSMPFDDIKKDENWKFTFTKDSENPILIEFDNFDGAKSAASPAFLMAMLLKEHFKAIKSEKIDGDKKPKEIGFCLFDAWKEDERKRIEEQLQEACNLLKIECSFVNV